MSKLDGKVALITGGTTGIGAATARLFRDEGATVIATGSSAESIARVRNDLPGVELVAADQADTARTAALAEEVRAKHGRLDVAFINAGIGYFAPLEAVDEAFYDRQFNVNVRGAFFTAKHFAPLIPAGGSIIFTASTAASSGFVNGAVYAATKAALRSFARSLGAELAPKGVRVNAVSPGPVETPIFGKTGMSEQEIAGFMEGILTQVPLGRIGQSDEIARAVLFLAADATFTTGGELIAGGGMVDI